MIYLMHKGFDTKIAFKIMEVIYKLRVKNYKEPLWEEYKEIMKNYDIPNLYFYFLERVNYMFPKAHVVSYVFNAFRIA